MLNPANPAIITNTVDNTMPLIPFDIAITSINAIAKIAVIIILLCISFGFTTFKLIMSFPPIQLVDR